VAAYRASDRDRDCRPRPGHWQLEPRAASASAGRRQVPLANLAESVSIDLQLSPAHSLPQLGRLWLGAGRSLALWPQPGPGGRHPPVTVNVAAGPDSVCPSPGRYAIF
jgi:hypothetical protein